MRLTASSRLPPHVGHVTLLKLASMEQRMSRESLEVASTEQQMSHETLQMAAAEQKMPREPLQVAGVRVERA